MTRGIIVFLGFLIFSIVLVKFVGSGLGINIFDWITETISFLPSNVMSLIKGEICIAVEIFYECPRQRNFAKKFKKCTITLTSGNELVFPEGISSKTFISSRPFSHIDEEEYNMISKYI